MSKPQTAKRRATNPRDLPDRNQEEERELSHIIQDREFEREIARASPDSFVNPGHMGYIGPDE